jgi:uncharacterized membrane protein (DUF106 family)
MEIIHILICMTVFIVCYPWLIQHLFERPIEAIGVTFMLATAAVLVWAVIADAYRQGWTF